MNFAGYIPTTDLQVANEFLEAESFGPDCFGVPVYDGPTATGAMFHCWSDAAFQAVVETIPGVVLTFPNDLPVPSETPAALVVAGAQDEGMAWGGDSPLLTGTVMPGLYHDSAGVLWWVVQGYNTAIYPNPAAIPALIRRAKIPGEAIPWVQPLDQFDAYKLVNPFTAEPDMSTHNGFTWKVSQADGSGNNVWEPGVFGWVKM